MRRLFTGAAVALAVLTVGGTALADQVVQRFQGNILAPGGNQAFAVVLSKDTHFAFHMHSKTPGATFSLFLWKGAFNTVAEAPANGRKDVEMEFSPVVAGTYTLIVHADTGGGNFKGNLKIDNN